MNLQDIADLLGNFSRAAEREAQQVSGSRAEHLEEVAESLRSAILSLQRADYLWRRLTTGE